ncbi:MAG: hypothetical protein ACUZ8E_18315 [Candidatus Anammoxibacter sp.]
MKFSLKFWIGIVLLVTNQPFGWAGMIICNSIAIKEEDYFFSVLGFGIYGLSWGMLGLGALLSGREGIEYSKNLFRTIWKRFRR